MRWLLPRSLQGQMLLAIAAALLIAQGLSALVIYRGMQERREAAIATSLAFRFVGRLPRPEPDFQAIGPVDGARAGSPRRSRGPRLTISDSLPMTATDQRDEALEQRLGAMLADHGVHLRQLVVFERPLAEDALSLRRFEQRTRRDRGPAAEPPETVMLAAARPHGSEVWIVARSFVREGSGRLLPSLILQTLLLFAVLFGAIAVLLRRITGPLAALTARVEGFARAPGTAGEPLPLAGPEDTRSLIAAHNAMEARIAALLDEKDVMLGAIGHDLKTPLAALRVRIEAVADEDERARMAAVIEDIARTLDDILSLARVGRPGDPVEMIELGSLADALVEEYEDMGEDVVMAEPPRLALPARATWLRRGLRNLIGNALRYGGGARVSLTREGAWAVLRVEDDGPGIPDDRIAAMMEPFARLEASRNSATGGAGLGLALARAIAEQHGGSLTLANRRGASGAIEGLTAVLRLPAPP